MCIEPKREDIIIMYRSTDSSIRVYVYTVLAVMVRYINNHVASPVKVDLSLYRRISLNILIISPLRERKKRQCKRPESNFHLSRPER